MPLVSEIPRSFEALSFRGGISRAFQTLLRNLGFVDQDSALVRALDSASHGICVVDGSEKLVFVNQTFCRIYGQPKATLPRGRSFEDILAASIALGNYKGLTVEKVIADRRAFITCGVPGTFLQAMGDGRLIAISQQPIESGGWIAVYEDVTERRNRERNLKFLAHHDALTMLPNRLLLSEQLADALSSLVPGQCCSLLYLDLDGFKPVNDRFGHIAGDELLAQVAARLTTELEGDQVAARLGGDEFAVLLPRAGFEEANQLASRIERSLNLPFWVGATSSVRVGVSVGVATAPQHGRTAGTLIKFADRELYRQKRSHRMSRGTGPRLSSASTALVR